MIGLRPGRLRCGPQESQVRTRSFTAQLGCALGDKAGERRLACVLSERTSEGNYGDA